jgi:hypothetical protein
MPGEVFRKLPAPILPVRVRADGAFFDRKVVEFIEERNAFYVIVARLTPPVKNRLGGLRCRRISAGVSAAEFQYCPQDWKRPRRFVVNLHPCVRNINPPEHSDPQSLIPLPTLRALQVTPCHDMR